MAKMSAPMLTGGKTLPGLADTPTAPTINPRTRFRTFWDTYNEFGPSTPEGGNPNPLLIILPRLYEGDYTVGEALGILFSGSPLDTSEEALERARGVYFEPSKQQLAAVSEVLGIGPKEVKDQLQQHNATSDPVRAFTEGNKYATEESVKEIFWEEQILPALEAGGDFIKTAIFGPAPSGGPKSIDTLFEEWMDTSLNELKGPVTLTVDPEEGLLLEIMIPVNFEVNGEPLKIEIFDEDGNFTGVQEIGRAVYNAAEGAWGEIVDGVFRPIGEIFTGEEGTVVERIFDAATSVISTAGLSAVEQGGWLSSVLGEEVRRQIGFNPDTNTIEGVEEGTLDVDDDLTGDGAADDIGQETEDDAFDGMFDGPEEDEPPAKVSTPRGRTVVDKEGNIIGISGDDGNFYVQDEEGNWVVRPEGEDVGGEAELPADTTIEQDAPVKKEVEIADVDPLGQDTAEEEDVPEKDGGLGPSPDTTPEYSQEEDFDQDGIPNYLDADADNDGVPDIIDGDPFDPNVGETFGPDDGKADDGKPVREDPVLVPRKEEPQPIEDDGDDDEPPVVINGRDGRDGVDGQDGRDGVDGQDGRDGIDGRDGRDGVDGKDGVDGLQGERGERGETGATGARGAPGAPAPRGGYMGGLSYQLPGFVGVQYQPKDYTMELDRIIGESLFGDMI